MATETINLREGRSLAQVWSHEPKISLSVETVEICAPQPEASPPLINVINIPAPHTGHIRIIELNRPAARNAISKDLLLHLASEIAAIQSQYNLTTYEELPHNPASKSFGATRALIIASADEKSFCAGADLKERKSFTTAETEDFLALLRSTLDAIENLPIPTIAAIGSVALGGGLELALATSLRVVGCNAQLALPETKLGIIPGAGGMRRLAALVGVTRARDLVLTGRRVDGREAFRLGIADRLVEKSSSNQRMWKMVVPEEALELARSICEGAPLAIRMALKVLRDPSSEAEEAAYERVLKSSDRDIALQAFAEKIKPVFEGK